MSDLTTRIQLLDDRARQPLRAHDTDTGYDLTVIDIHSIIGDTIYFRTGIAVQPPEGYYFEIVPRSSISKLPLQLANSVGIIDQNYRGEILIPVRVTHTEMGMNVGRTHFPNGIVRMFDARPVSLYEVGRMVVARRPVLFQIILRQRLNTEFEQVVQLDETERGEGGFGSTDSAGVTRASARKGLVKRSE